MKKGKEMTNKNFLKIHNVYMYINIRIKYVKYK